MFWMINASSLSCLFLFFGPVLDETGFVDGQSQEITRFNSDGQPPVVFIRRNQMFLHSIGLNQTTTVMFEGLFYMVCQV